MRRLFVFHATLVAILLLARRINSFGVQHQHATPTPRFTDNNRAIAGSQSIGLSITKASLGTEDDIGHTHHSWLRTATATSSYALVHQQITTALRHFNGERGLEALQSLAQLCQQRLPYQFKFASHNSDSLVRHVPSLLPKAVTQAIAERLDFMTLQGWWSTNPDSVDGLPSFHLNLISNGVPILSETNSYDGDNDDDFERNLRYLIHLVKPYIYEELLPLAQKLSKTSSLNVQDVFLRRYGDDVIDGQSRSGISAHYDVYSQLTAVCALDDSAATGMNGLYTTEVISQVDEPIMGKTSNHASLRRFFPLQCGDAVLHSWDVLHGVDVRGNQTRTSLIVWFSSNTEERPNDEAESPLQHLDAPWLLKGKDVDTSATTQFVLASALESLSITTTGDADAQGATPSYHAYGNKQRLNLQPCNLYFQSASKGNAFALTRLGSLCEEGDLPVSMLSELSLLLDQLQKLREDLHAAVESERSALHTNLAKRCWLEGAIRGNHLAQSALAGELMLEGIEQDDIPRRQLAATLFGLAAQQGDESAVDALQRVVKYEADRGGETDTAFVDVLRIANAACCSLP
ncbi:hypothetical protein MPSEU_000252600 [Mayamaea pseudoterrestris]|nr:hypothetical protein MPSEU_000252600 [Mayamaea pseudoterrestris]